MASNWQHRPFSDFLVERTNRYKPNDKAISGYQRLDKIDFSGNMHFSSKISKTDMILIMPGDLVISGINVAKGALAVYEGLEPACATIHYSSYIFDKEKIEIGFLKRFLKSPAFLEALRNQVKGGIKTEIKPKHLLPLKIGIPDLSVQKQINLHFEAIENELGELSYEIGNQEVVLAEFRQTILQEAIEGKLTLGWRKANPVKKGNPDYDTETLLNVIRAEKRELVEKRKNSKEKLASPLESKKFPFDLPEGWAWCKLGEVAEGFQYGSSSKSLKSGKIPVLRMGNIQAGKVDWQELVYTNDKQEIEQYRLKEGDLLFNRTNSRELVGKTAIFDGCRNAIFAGYLIRFSPLGGCSSQYFNILMNSKLHRDWCNQNKIDALGQSNINATKLRDFLVPLAPRVEQQVIAERVEKLLAIVDVIKVHVDERKMQIEDMMQVVLREAFEDGM